MSPRAESRHLGTLVSRAMACKARRLGEDLQARLDHNILRHHQPPLSSLEHHAATPCGSLLAPFFTRCQNYFSARTVVLIGHA